MVGPSSVVLLGTLLHIFSAVGAGPLNSTLDYGNAATRKGEYFTIRSGFPHWHVVLLWGTIHACNGEFLIGHGTCASCPRGAGETCEAFDNQTIIDTKGNLGASVPGGQRYYISKEFGDYGALRYTRPQDTATAKPNEHGSYFYRKEDELMYSGGEDPDEWQACPVTGARGLYKVYMKMEDEDYSGCSDIDIHLVPAASKYTGAYQYD
ncbi:MAG: hypothetical protein M1831_005168 [Alyxoria varia]|nr:MAG: hypothetical protein M1831_005168 [Alyxoria varia]